MELSGPTDRLRLEIIGPSDPLRCDGWREYFGIGIRIEASCGGNSWQVVYPGLDSIESRLFAERVRVCIGSDAAIQTGEHEANWIRYSSSWSRPWLESIWLGPFLSCRIHRLQGEWEICIGLHGPLAAPASRLKLDQVAAGSWSTTWLRFPHTECADALVRLTKELDLGCRQFHLNSAFKDLESDELWLNGLTYELGGIREWESVFALLHPFYSWEGLASEEEMINQSDEWIAQQVLHLSWKSVASLLGIQSVSELSVLGDSMLAGRPGEHPEHYWPQLNQQKISVPCEDEIEIGIMHELRNAMIRRGYPVVVGSGRYASWRALDRIKGNIRDFTAGAARTPDYRFHASIEPDANFTMLRGDRNDLIEVIRECGFEAMECHPSETWLPDDGVILET